VNCGDLMTQFGLSVDQASADLNRCTCLAHNSMDHDRRLRTTVCQPGFKAVFHKLDEGHYLAQLHSVVDGTLGEDDRRMACLPDDDSAPTPTGGVYPATLRAVVVAIHDTESIKIQCQSLSRPETAWRWIAPHAVTFDGFWWHAPTFCLAYVVFKNFLLRQFLDIRGSQQSKTPADNDFDWHANVTLEIRPHSDLTEALAKVIAVGCGMLGGKAEIKVRPALLCYALRRVGLDTYLAARKPQDQLIVLLNREIIYEDHGWAAPNPRLSGDVMAWV
jgi:hypothetical protein